MENKTYLHEQIEVLRNLIDHVHNHITEDIDFKQLIIVLDAIGKGATRLATLIKTQKELGDEKSFPDDLADALEGIVPGSEGG